MPKKTNQKPRSRLASLYSTRRRRGAASRRPPPPRPVSRAPRKISVFIPTLERRSPKSVRSLPTRPRLHRPGSKPPALGASWTSGRCRLWVGKLRSRSVCRGGAGARVGRLRVAASYRRAGGWPCAALPRASGQLVSGWRFFADAAPRGRTGVLGNEAGGGSQQARVEEPQVGSSRAAGGGHAGGGCLLTPRAASRNCSSAPRLIKRLNPPPRGAARHRPAPPPGSAARCSGGAGNAGALQ